jgi:hypothetical protein
MNRIAATVAALLTTLLTATLIAPAANAADSEITSQPSYEIDGGVGYTDYRKTPKRETEPKPDCADCTPGGTGSATTIASSWAQVAWFDDPKSYDFSTPYGSSQFNFGSGYVLAGCPAPKADKGYGYNGNAIPMPGGGSYTVKTWMTVNVYTHTDATPYYQMVTDPETNEVTVKTVGTNTWTWDEFQYSVGCGTATAPGVNAVNGITAMDYRVDGPYSQSKEPMTPVSEGGTMTRTPLNDGVISHLGKEVYATSSLGKTMAAPRTGRPSTDAVFSFVLPNRDEKFDKAQTDTISDLGRYEAPTQRFGALVGYTKAAMPESLVNRLFPGSLTRATSAGAYRYVGGAGYFIQSIDAARKLTPQASFYTVMCKDGTDKDKRSQFTTVAAASTEQWNVQPWNDTDADYYTWNCGGVTPGSKEIRTADILQCDRYGQAADDLTVVDGKPAAPIESAHQIMDGTVHEVDVVGNTVSISSAADPLHVSWKPVRINTQDGKDIRTASTVKNAVWEYTYQLDGASSPLLKDAGVNDRTQPYNGWVDGTATSVHPSEISLDRLWTPGQGWVVNSLPYTYATAAYTYTTTSTYMPHVYTTGTTTVWGHNGWHYWWGTGGSDCGRWSNGDPWCRQPTYGWMTQTTTVKSAPMSGFFDNGTSYQRNVTVKDAAPAGWSDNGTGYAKVNPAPAGYTDAGNGYISKTEMNLGKSNGGMEFNTYRKSVDEHGLAACTIDSADYTSTGVGSDYGIECGDNVTDTMRAGYFRFYMSSTAGSDGWTVTPHVKVTADVNIEHTEVTALTPDANGTLVPSSTVTSEWVRSSYDCPGAPLTVDVERVVS